MTISQVEFVIFLMVIAAIAYILFSAFKKNKAAPSKPVKKWSGKATGVFPIKQLTQEQSLCLSVLTYTDTVCKEGVSHEKGMSHFFPRTLGSLVKHGFIEEIRPGWFKITDHGLNAHENLPWR